MIVNGRAVAVPPKLSESRLLDFLRDHLHLTGTKFGCGVGLCGACTVHVDGAPRRACQTSLSEVTGARVTTIEGLADTHPGDGLHPVQAAWIAERVPQCGYCQAGQIMAAAALLQRNRRPSTAAIRRAMDGNLCRCGTYNRIVDAIQRAAEGR